MGDGPRQSAGGGSELHRVVVVACTGCQRPFAVPARYAGRRVACPKCHTAVDVPTGARSMVAVECTACRHKFAVPEDYRGRQIRCPNCSTSQPFGTAESADVLSEQPAGGGSASKSGGSSSSSEIRRLRRFLHCPVCNNVFPVFIDKPANNYSCPKCRGTFLDGHCVRQDELTGQWFHHTSMFGGVKYGPYETREAATSAMIDAAHKRK